MDWSIVQTIIDKAVSAVGTVVTGTVNSIVNLTQWASQQWDDYDAQMVQLVRDAGMSIGQYKMIKDQMADIGNRLGEDGLSYIQKYGKSAGEAMKLINEYQNAVGRNIMLSDEQLGRYTALQQVLGNAGITIANSFQNFGIDAVQTEKIMSNVLNDANTTGIRMDRITSNMQENMQKIQMYTFDNGVQGFTKMAQRAAEVNVSMREALSFADKMRNVGDAIKIGANLQVLGGSFSTMSNPLEMFYEATSDVGALQERMVNMFKDLGTYNKDTKQVELTRFNRIRVQEAAQQMGVSAEEMMKMINTSAIKDEIAAQMSVNITDERQRQFIQNTAQINDQGEAVVMLGNEMKKVSDLNDKDVELLQQLTNANTGQSINQIAIDVHTMKERMDMFTKARQSAVQAQLVKSPQEAIASIGSHIGNLLGTVGHAVGKEGLFGGFGDMLNNLTSNMFDGAGNIIQGATEGIANFAARLSSNVEGSYASMAAVNKEGADQARALAMAVQEFSKLVNQGGTGDEIIGKWYSDILSSPMIAQVGALVDGIKHMFKGNESGSTTTTTSNGRATGGLINAIPIASTPHSVGGTIALDGIQQGGLLTGGARGVEVPITQTFTDTGINENTAQSGEYVVNAAATDRNLSAISTINSFPDVAFDVMPRASWSHDDGGLVAPENIVSEVTTDATSNIASIQPVNVTATINGNIGVDIPETIKIDFGNGQTGDVDLRSLKSSFLKTIADAIKRVGRNKGAGQYSDLLEPIAQQIESNS